MSTFTGPRDVPTPTAHPDALPPGAERFNFVTHLAGAVAALAGTVWLGVTATGTLARAALIVYGVSLVVLFSASTLHHVLARTPWGHRFSRRLDHVSIYLLIAGTYTPVCVLAVPPWPGLAILAVVWAFGLAGIALKLLRPFTSRWKTIGLYVAMGWMAVFAAGPIIRTFNAEGLILLATGGIVYTVGAVIYALGKPDPWPRFVGYHGVWHVFVLVAAGLHFAFIARHVAA